MLIRTSQDLGAVIRERRRSLGLGQRQLADRMGVGRQWVINMEAGKGTAQLTLALQALRALGLTLTVQSPHTTASEQPVQPLPGVGTIDDVITRHRKPK